MKLNIYSLLILCIFTSCYTYRSIDDEKDNNAVAKTDSKTIAPNSKNAKVKSIREKLEPPKIYKIKVDDKQYKIQVEGWERDSLVAHTVNKPDKKIKFHKNQIDENKIAEKRFSQPLSDILTVATYAGIAVLAAVFVF